jgi:hypothetical protein
MRCAFKHSLFGVTLLLLSQVPSGNSVVLEDEVGRWPEDWPKELEPLRQQARTLSIGAGICEEVYEIPFSDRETFERAWPYILQVKSRWAPIALYRFTRDVVGSRTPFGGMRYPTVRIRAPSSAYIGGAGGEPDTVEEADELVKRGEMLRAAPPWPDEIRSATGVLPEFVRVEKVDGESKWVPAQQDKPMRGFLHRVRVEIELIVDGEIIDLNRVPLPPDTPIIDKRWQEPSVDQ